MENEANHSFSYRIWRRYQSIADALKKYKISRWVIVVILLGVYIFRAYLFYGTHVIRAACDIVFFRPISVGSANGVY